MAGPDEQLQADVADMQALERQNGGIRYLLREIDVFSKYAWVSYKVKRRDVRKAAFSKVLTEAARRKPRSLNTENKDF